MSYVPHPAQQAQRFALPKVLPIVFSRNWNGKSTPNPQNSTSKISQVPVLQNNHLEITKFHKFPKVLESGPEIPGIG
jgi:hypothetical protein